LTLHRSARNTLSNVKISELADEVGVPTSTVRYYERVGLLEIPARTTSGYRDYDDRAANRLLFITRARRMGLTCEQIAEVLPIWDGVTCGPAHEQIARLVEDKRAEIAERIRELERFADQLEEVGAALAATPPPAECRTDLTCCVPEASENNTIPVELAIRRRAAS
jgi:DNA-binding transcriptional MerR regulator